MPRGVKNPPAETPNYIATVANGIRGRDMPPGFLNFARRRIQGFTDHRSLEQHTLMHIMIEVYLQGIKDALQVLDKECPITGELKR